MTKPLNYHSEQVAVGTVCISLIIFLTRWLNGFNYIVFTYCDQNLIRPSERVKTSSIFTRPYCHYSNVLLCLLFDCSTDGNIMIIIIYIMTCLCFKCYLGHMSPCTLISEKHFFHRIRLQMVD